MRVRMNTTTRGYEGAARGRSEDDWITRPSSADTEIFVRQRTLRDRSRDLVRNNPYAAKAVASLVSNIIGDGIVPRPVTGNVKKDKKIRDAFDAWALKCDVEGQLDFYALQSLACREMIEGGEVLIRKRLRKKTGPDDVPLELQILEADFLDLTRNGLMTSAGLSIQGVEIDQDTQKRINYWLFPQHPGSLWFNFRAPIVSERVPAAEICHVYEKQRTQVRGVPWGTPSIQSLRLLADYELAEIVRKKIEACNVAIVTGAEDEEEDNVGMKVLDDEGNSVEKFEPGMILYAHGAKEIKFNTPTSIGGYGEYKSSMLHTIAAGYRIPYELISGDLAEVNFSSMRGGLVEFRRLLRAVQWHILIQMALQPIWEWWCELAFLAGVIDTPKVPVEWGLPKFEWVDPVADAQADQLSVRNGFRTWQEVVAETGRNPDDVIEDIRAFNEKVDRHQIVLDSDPRRTNVKGAQQPVEAVDDTGDEPELSRPNRGARIHGRKKDPASVVRPRRASRPREL